MKYVWGWLVLIVGIGLNPNLAFAKNGSFFKKNWDVEIEAPKSTLKAKAYDSVVGYETDIQDLLTRRDILFVSGIMNEIADLGNSYYYYPIQEAETELKMRAGYYGPSSRLSMADNAELVAKRISEAYQGRPLILFGHSKGAAEIFYAILRHPELIWDGKVEKLFLLQAAIHGSPLVKESSDKFPMKLLSQLFPEGWRSLDPNQAEQVLAGELSHYLSILEKRYGEFGREATLKMHEKIHFATYWLKTFQVESSICWPMRGILGFLIRGNLYGRNIPNDSLVETEKMKCEQMGIDLGVVRTDHIAPVVSLGLPKSNWIPKFETGSEEEQTAFLRAALGMLYSVYDAPTEEQTEALFKDVVFMNEDEPLSIH